MKTTSIKKNILTVFAALLLITISLPQCSFAGENIPVKIGIPITYIVNGNENLAGGDRFTLVPDDPLAPMPEDMAEGKKTITVRKEGSYSFGDIVYRTPGVWWYTVSRDLTDVKGVTKDDSIFRVKVIALNDGHGYVLAYLKGEKEKRELIYTDRVAPETGDHSMILASTCIALTSGAGLTFLIALRLRRRKKEV